MKKNKIIIALIIITVIIALITLLHSTLAVSSTITNDNDVYTINLTENNNTVVTVPGNSTKTVIYHIKNTSKGNVKYGVGYTGSNISIKTYDDTIDKAEGTIAYGESKFVKLYISNKSATSSTTTIKTVLGYEHGGDLIVPSGYTLVNSSVTNAQELIKKLYKDSTKTQVINNNITYNYASSVNLMNDRLGGTTTSLDGGNIRYYGASPNNYIYFNCTDYLNQNSNTCEIWRIIGVFDNKIKIARNYVLQQNYSWDNKNTSTGAATAYGENDWSTARLMKLLNPSDYFTIDANDQGLGQSLYYNGGTGKCYSGYNNATISCDLTTIGIRNNDTRNKISENTWYLGGYNSSNVFSNKLYQQERGEDVYSGRPTIWRGKIALLYMSDYGYAAEFGTDKCNSTLIKYNDTTCTSNNWLYKNNIYLWLLNMNNTRSYICWGINDTGRASTEGYDCTNTISVKPTLYLNENVMITSGDGSSSSPYQLAN